MILILSGEDTFRSHKRLGTLIAAFKKKFDPSGYNITIFDGQAPAFEKVQSAFGTMSFLGDRRLLIFQDFFSAKSTEKQKQVLSFLLDRDSETQVIIFWQRSDLPGASSRLSIVKHATRETFDLLSGATLIRWIQDEAKKRNLSVSYDAVRVLAERVGGDLWKMSNVLDQLSAYTEGSADVNDAYEFTDVTFNDNIFHLTDALGQKQSKEALELLFDQLRSGAHPLYILTMLLRHFRILLQVASGIAQSPDAIGVHPFALQKAREQARLFSITQISQAFVELQRIESSLKLGAKDPETLFSRFIFRVTK